MSRIFAYVLLLGSLILSSSAQTIPPDVEPRPLGEPRVTAISPRTNLLGGSITLTISNLQALLEKASDRQRQIVLFVNGNELSDATRIGLDEASGTISFQLRRTAKNKDVWAPLLQYPLDPPVRPIKVSIGVQGDLPLRLDAHIPEVFLRLASWNWWTMMWLGVFIVLRLIFTLLAAYSDILRIPLAEANGRRPFSLSRTQAAFWLFLTSMSFAFIWVVTGDLATLNGSTLALLGISSGTYLASALLDPTKNATPSNPTNPSTSTAIKPTDTRMDGLIARIQGIRFFGNFLVDILSDESGISVHRFQIFVWTIVLGIIFGVSVLNELAMPQFNETLLALMGISSATYVGAKLVQKPGS
jgi:hypothetical protein